MARHATLQPPPSSTFRSIVSSGFGLVTAIPIGIWINLVTADNFDSVQYLALNKHNIALLPAFLLIIVNLALVRRWDIRETEWKRVTGIIQAQHTLAVQRSVLSTYCMLLKEMLGCRVSARLFEAKYDGDQIELFQIRDVFIENEYFPQENAYTSVSSEHPDFVHCRAFRERAPIYTLLPDDHISKYPLRERTMVEPSQKWVLAAPIQRLDEMGRARDHLRPRGVIVFYGRTLPSALPDTDRGDAAKAVSRDAAEAFVYMALGTTPAIL